VNIIALSIKFAIKLKVSTMDNIKAQITIKDIARALNCSPSTVSRALKDSKDISKETRELIKNYAKVHNYKPNFLAQNLRMSHTHTIGVIVPQIVHHFFSCVLDGVEKIASSSGYNMLVAQSDESYDKEVNIVHSFLAERVCGVITSLAKDTTHYEHYQELLDNNIPIVFYDRICTGVNTERVVVDDYAGAFSAVEYLIQTGCKRILFYTSPLHMEISKNRRNGYMDALRHYNIPFNEDMIKICDTREKAIAITSNILEQDQQIRPDGFFAINDETASGILYSCKVMGIKVPEEVSICGFSDGVIAQSTDPKLTTVEQHGKEVGECAVKTLIEKIQGKAPKNRIVKTNLIVRGTTK
jgi:LacI family transcriptional regulator